jgi:plastocyanin
MRRAALLISVALSTAGVPAVAHGAVEHGAGHGPGHAPGADTGSHAVAIANRAFSPARVTVLEGDSVAWRNNEVMVHNVSVAGGAVFSGSLSRGASFSHRFTDAGSYAYLCTLHPFMTGRVDVHAALLQPGSTAVLAGHEVALDGRAPAGATVTIEEQPIGAPAFTAVATVRADSGGRFHGAVRPQANTAYRAVHERGASPAVTVTVASQLRVRVSARRSGRFTRIRVAAPGAGRATAVLQLYSRERFTWVDRKRGRLGTDGRTAFRLRAGLRYHARVVIGTPQGSTLGTSRSVKLPR